jgi:putative phosphotransacetylase
VLLVGPEGHVLLDAGIGLAWRHVHLDPQEAEALSLKDGDEVEAEIGGDRGLVFRRVWVRVGPNMRSEFHVDVDEANACGLATGQYVRILR